MTDSPTFDASTVVELNVGGVVYATTLGTLTADPDSLLGRAFLRPPTATDRAFARDARGRYFVDRDGVLFRYVLDYLRCRRLVLPECFREKDRLREEADFYGIAGLIRSLGIGCRDRDEAGGGDLDHPRTLCHTLSGGEAAKVAGESSLPGINGVPTGTPRRSEAGYILVGYRGTFAFGRDGCQADVKFRKMWRILACGRVALCREVFKDTLNESRDVDRGTTDRYTSRFFLKHTFLEQAFDMLQEAGFRMIASCGSGTNSAGEMKPGMDSEENKWNHYNEFVFCRP